MIKKGQYSYPTDDTSIDFPMSIFSLKFNFSVLTPPPNRVYTCSIVFGAGSSVLGTLQARILEWAATPFSRISSQLRDRARVSHVSCTGRQGSLPLAPPGKPWAQGLRFNSAALSPHAKLSCFRATAKLAGSPCGSAS